MWHRFSIAARAIQCPRHFVKAQFSHEATISPCKDRTNFEIFIQNSPKNADFLENSINLYIPPHRFSCILHTSIPKNEGQHHCYPSPNDQFTQKFTNWILSYIPGGLSSHHFTFSAVAYQTTLFKVSSRLMSSHTCI